MNENYQSIRGYKVIGDPPKPDRQLSLEYLKQKPEAAHALTILRAGAIKEKANCLDREDEFSGNELMSDRDAALACAGCPVLDLCRDYAEKAHPAWGTFYGRVYGRGLMETTEEDLNA